MEKPQKLTQRGWVIIAGLLVIALVWWWLFPPNPLLGKWVAVDKESDPFRASVTLIGHIEFTKDYQIQSNGSFPVRYDVERGHVTTHITGFADGKDIAEIYTVKHTLKGIIIQRPEPFVPDGMVEYRKAD